MFEVQNFKISSSCIQYYFHEKSFEKKNTEKLNQLDENEK